MLELHLAVPANDADIEFAVEDAGTDDAVAPDGGVIPALAGRAGNAVAVEVGGDALRPLAGDELTEDAADDLGAFLVDLALAPDRLTARVKLVNDTIAIGIAAADLARFDTAPDAAMGLDGEVFQERRKPGTGFRGAVAQAAAE